MSQSSSTPLHASTGGVQVPHPHVAVQLWRPVELHDVLQFCTAPGTHWKSSSICMSQSSSTALHASTGAFHVQSVAQLRVPVVPHVVVHEPVLFAQHPKPSSQPPLQSSSSPLHVSD